MLTTNDETRRPAHELDEGVTFHHPVSRAAVRVLEILDGFSSGKAAVQIELVTGEILVMLAFDNVDIIINP